MPNFDIFTIKLNLTPERKEMFKLKPKLAQAQRPRLTEFREAETCIKQKK